MLEELFYPGVRVSPIENSEPREKPQVKEEVIYRINPSIQNKDDENEPSEPEEEEKNIPNQQNARLIDDSNQANAA